MPAPSYRINATMAGRGMPDSDMRNERVKEHDVSHNRTEVGCSMSMRRIHINDSGVEEA